MADNLNLDQLLPEKRIIIFNGKEYECKHPTVEQMLRVADLEVQLTKAKSVKEALTKINNALKPIVPKIEEIDLTKDQLTALVRFVMDGTKPEGLKKAQDVTPKKKVDLQE